MRSLRTKQVELDQEKQKAKEAYERLVAARNEIEERKAALEVERRHAVAEARAGLVEEIRVAREEVRATIAKLQRAAGGDAVREAMRLATEAARSSPTRRPRRARAPATGRARAESRWPP